VWKVSRHHAGHSLCIEVARCINGKVSTGVQRPIGKMKTRFLNRCSLLVARAATPLLILAVVWLGGIRVPTAFAQHGGGGGHGGGMGGGHGGGMGGMGGGHFGGYSGAGHGYSVGSHSGSAFIGGGHLGGGIIGGGHLGGYYSGGHAGYSIHSGYAGHSAYATHGYSVHPYGYGGHWTFPGHGYSGYSHGYSGFYGHVSFGGWGYWPGWYYGPYYSYYDYYPAVYGPVAVVSANGAGQTYGYASDGPAAGAVSSESTSFAPRVEMSTQQAPETLPDNTNAPPRPDNIPANEKKGLP